MIDHYDDLSDVPERHHFPVYLGTEDLLVGVPMGTLFTVNSCNDGFTVLSKRFLESTTKRKSNASNAAVNMAAQELAVKLNIRAGAGFPGCLAALIIQADNLLTAVHYDGTSTDNLTPAQSQQFNTLAGIFDAYNNNKLSATCTPIP